MHPLQGGFFRRKIRQERRPGLPRENPVVFYPRRVCEVIDTHVRLAAFYWSLHRIRKKVERDPRPISIQRCSRSRRSHCKRSPEWTPRRKQAQALRPAPSFERVARYYAAAA